MRLTPAGIAVYDQHMQPIYNRMREAGEFDFDAVNRLMFGASWAYVAPASFEEFWQKRLAMGDPDNAESKAGALRVWDENQAIAVELVLVLPDEELRERLLVIWAEDFWKAACG